MFHTSRETTEATLTRLITAMDRQQPVTITYLKEEKDNAGKRTGALVETLRTIEVYDFVVTQAGAITIKAMDRETGEARTFRLDRIRAYTVHRSATYVVEREIAVDAEPAKAPTLREPLLDAVADLDETNPVDTLAWALAA